MTDETQFEEQAQNIDFETIEVDIPEEQQHQMIKLFAQMYMSPASTETFTQELQQGVAIERALYLAAINEMMLVAIRHQLEHETGEQPNE